MKKISFTAENGVKVEGVLLYHSPITRAYSPFTNRVFDEIVYAQNRLVKLHRVMKPNDKGKHEEFRKPQIEIICEYVTIPELDKMLYEKN